MYPSFPCLFFLSIKKYTGTRSLVPSPLLLFISIGLDTIDIRSPEEYLMVFRRTIIIIIRFRHFSYPNFPISHLVSYENPIPDVHPTNPVYPIFPRHNDSKEPYNAPTLAMNSLLLANPSSRNRISRTKKKSEAMSLPWKRLIRFIATDGRTLRGEPILPTPTTDLGFITESNNLQARVIEGDDIYDTTGKTRVTDEIVSVKTILGPLAQADVPILRCVGLNYAKHGKVSHP